MKKWLLLTSVLFLASGCVDIGSYTESKPVSIDGSSTVYPILRSGLEAYRNNGNRNHDINLDYSGTSRGLQKLCSGEIGIASASRSITAGEIRNCNRNGIDFHEIPIASDGIAVVVNAKSIWVNYLTVSELKKIWQAESEGVVEQWSDIRAGWPDQDINLYGPGSASGTHSYFAESVIGSTTSRGDYVASEDDEILVESIASDPNGIAFFGLGYYRGHSYSLKLVPIDDENPANGTQPVIPSIETVKEGTYQPLSRTMYLYVARNALGTGEAYDFLDFLMQRAVLIVDDAGYIPQPADLYKNTRRDMNNWTNSSS